MADTLSPQRLTSGAETTPEMVAANLVWNEKTQYEEASSEIRELLRKAYKNYFSLYDDPLTKWTKREKIFVPMTKWITNTGAGETYVTPRAFTVLPREEGDIKKARIWQELIRYQLDQTNFEAFMLDFAMEMSLLGTAVTHLGWDAENDLPSIKHVPLLNCYIDPTATSIQDAPSFIVKWLIPKAEAMKLSVFKGKLEDVEGIKRVTQMEDKDQQFVQQYLTNQGGDIRHEEEMIWVWLRVGPLPKGHADEGKEGEIWAIGSKRDNFKVMTMRKSPFKHGKRPFEECWYRRVLGRWYGIGIGEDLRDLQRYVNTVVNQRIDNAEIVQHKMFLYRKGAGIDPRMLIARPGGAIPVNDPASDIRELEYTDIRQSSYTDEQNIYRLAQQVTSAFDIIRGGGNPETASEAIIQERGASGAFSHIKRYVNAYLERVVEQVMQLNMQFLDNEVVIRIIGNQDELRDFDDVLGTSQQIRTTQKFRFITLKTTKEIQGLFDFDVDIDESAPINKAVLINFLQREIELAAQIPQSGVNVGELFKELHSNMGLKGSRFFSQGQQQAPGAQQGIPALPGTNPRTSAGERPAVGGQSEGALNQQATSPRQITR